MWLEGGDRRIGKSTIIKITAEFFFSFYNGSEHVSINP